MNRTTILTNGIIDFLDSSISGDIFTETNWRIMMTITVIIIVILLIYEYVYKFYSRVRQYPRGPMPLPLIGNCLMLRKNLDRHLSYFFNNLANKYGDSYTFWVGIKPIVFINEISLAKEAFNKNDFSDRFGPSLETQLYESLSGGHKLFAFIYNSEEYKHLRNISVQSIRKCLLSDKLSTLTHEIIFETVSVMKQRESGDAFVPNHYIESIFIRLITELIFGKKFPFDDHFIKQISVCFEEIQNNLMRLYVTDFIPICKYFINLTPFKISNDTTLKSFKFWYQNYVKHGISDDSFGVLGEALISCANAARIKNSSDKTDEHLCEPNMIGTLLSLFLGASDTGHNTLKWIMLLMAYYPEMQKKMRNEINENIRNNKIADLSDKEKCVYVNAFICETLRYRNVIPFSVPHMTSIDTKLGNNSIPKGTVIILNQLSILNDSRYWKNPEIVNPERFIDSEQNLIASKMPSFIPFSTGKRMCVADKFAMNMLFLVLTSLLQATNGMTFVLSDKQSIDLDPLNFGVMLEPKTFKVCLENE